VRSRCTKSVGVTADFSIIVVKRANPWWHAYNKVNTLASKTPSKAKLGTVMHAMKALFLVIVQTVDFRETLVM
jgi:hypothetical protein